MGTFRAILGVCWFWFLGSVFYELEPVIVKGKTDPVAAFRVVAAHAERASMRGLTGTDIPLVGRGEELAVLRAVADEVRRGRGWIATVIGEAGVGKSRLTAELRDPGDAGRVDHRAVSRGRAL